MAQSRRPQPPKMRNIEAFDTEHDPIAIALKRLHDKVLAEDIPNEFLDLLAKIDRKIEDKAKG